MNELTTIVKACGVLVGLGADGAFAHLGTAWSLGNGDWVTAWSAASPPRNPQLIRTGDGRSCVVADWECEDGVAGFTSEPAEVSLAIAATDQLHKRDSLWALGFPSLIDHPAFALSHGSLDSQRYTPYLCPWVIEGTLVVFSSQDGWMPGRLHAGMGGGPVLASDGTVVGVLLDGAGTAEQVPLSRFRRLT